MMSEHRAPDVLLSKKTCPVCGNNLVVEVIRSVQVDVCEDHGVWLDVDELDSILDFEKYRARRRGYQQGKREGLRSGRYRPIFDDWFDEI